ncbi:MAG: L-rhamnose mutarotase [Rhodanobacter sp.]
MTRFYFALDLHDDPQAILDYERWHRAEQIWPEIVASIRAAGIDAMEIFRTGNRLVMAMEVGADYDPQGKAASDAANERVQAWERLMSTFQQPLPWAAPGQKWVPMTRIFSLSECNGVEAVLR